MTRISRLSIRSFRGIPGEVVLDFRARPTDQPGSMILFGDNGTGKSSIADAIEFVLQAQVARMRTYSDELVPITMSLASDHLPKVEAVMSNGTKVQRELTRREDGRLIVENRQPHQGFETSPVVMRRIDVLRFLQTPSRQRQIIFSDYLKQDTLNEELRQQKREVLKKKQIAAKKKRQTLITEFADAIGMHPRQIPLPIKEFNAFVGKPPVSTRISPHVHSIIEGIREIAATLGKIEREKGQISGKRASNPTWPRVGKFLVDSSATLSDSFQSLSTCKFVDRVSIEMGEPGGVMLLVKLHLKTGVVVTPQEVLSEANLDLLAVLTFLAIAQESARNGQGKLLVLDDVIQSVDSSVRLLVADYILRVFQDWQLLFTVHDRLWREQLRTLFQRQNHRFVEREIVRWSFDEGPVIRDSRNDPDQAVLDAIERADVQAICGTAGLLLEEICNTLSWTLAISVKRRRDDKYTIADLWPGILSSLKKSSIGTIAFEVDRRVHLRNLVGAHYNEWAQSVSTEEARRFGEEAVGLYWTVHCDRCFRWVERQSDSELACRCGYTKVGGVKL